MGQYSVDQGDIIAWCKEHALRIERGEAEPFHAVFTDWPYLLSFMGNGMRDAPHHVYLETHRADVEALVRLMGVEAWEAAAILWYRDVARGLASVCYPGAQHLGFGGARTDDLLAVGLRAAGWVVQDKAMYLYGSGMPHGLDIARAIDERRDEDRPAVYQVTAFIRAARDRLGLSNADIDDAFGMHGMAGHWTSAASQPAVPKPDQWAALKELLQLGDSMDAEVARLNSRKGDVGDNYKARQVLAVKKDGNKRRVPIMTSKRDHYTVTAPHSGNARRWHGYNTHLKPAYETLVYAYLPIEGTFAETATRYGTGGLNIDAARIYAPAGDRGDRDASTIAPSRVAYELSQASPASPAHPAGRWPPNVALQHAPGCELRGLREVRSTKAKPAEARMRNPDTTVDILRRAANDPGDWEGPGGEDGIELVEDWACAAGCPVAELDRQTTAPSEAGGASRFFFTSKPAEWERNAGLQDGAQHMQRRVNPGGLEHEPRFAPKLAYNPHPTLKAIRALAYFAGMLKRPAHVGGRLLVPFAGSGSEMIGAMLAGWPFIQGVELDQDTDHPGVFVDIARRRLAWWGQFASYEEAAEAVRQSRAILRSLPPEELRVVRLPTPDAAAASRMIRKTARPAVVYEQGSIFDV